MKRMKRARERIRDGIGWGVDAGNAEWGNFIKTVDKCQVKHSGSSSAGKKELVVFEFANSNEYASENGCSMQGACSRFGGTKCKLKKFPYQSPAKLNIWGEDMLPYSHLL